MFLINAVATVVALVCVTAIFFWLERTELTSAWGDVRRGIWMALARAGLMRLRSRPDSKNWRPHLLVLSGAPTRRWHLIELAQALTHNRALLTVSTVLTSAGVKIDRVNALESAIDSFFRQRGVQSLVRVVSAPNPFQGAMRLIEAYGLGPVVPNTILLGDSEEPDHRADYCRMIAAMHRARRNVAIVRFDPERGFGNRRRIDLWWGGLQKNGGLMMILAYLLRTSLDWRGAQVTVKMVVPSDAAATEARPNLTAFVAGTRTGAEVEVLAASGRPFEDILRQSSSEADLVFLGLAEPRAEDLLSYYERLHRRTDGLPTTVYVLASEDLPFGELLF
jgi:hypothetical protein